VDPDSFYVHFANTRHQFEPVPVGGTSPPVQVYELYNGGARVVKYELDMEPLAQVQAVSILIPLPRFCVCSCLLYITNVPERSWLTIGPNGKSPCTNTSWPLILDGMSSMLNRAAYARNAQPSKRAQSSQSLISGACVAGIASPK